MSGSFSLSAIPGGRGRRATVVDRMVDLRARLDRARAAGLTVGVVPTMGSLHQGHLSLVRRAAEECDVVAVTIFVNPLQFGPGEDLAVYPRDLDADVDLVTEGGGDVVFAPSVAEVYPPPRSAGPSGPAPVTATMWFEGLSDVYEGRSRPGHFAGVATVVNRLLCAAGACRAFFGEKDWQQLLVVRRLVDDLSLPVEIVACPTVREADGLACSSRNRRLSPAERHAALSLSQALVVAATLVAAGEHDPAIVRVHLADAVGREPMVELDYAAVVGADDLAALDRLTGAVRLLVAARVGATRLIDNVGVIVEPEADACRDDDRRTA